MHLYLFKWCTILLLACACFTIPIATGSAVCTFYCLYFRFLNVFIFLFCLLVSSLIFNKLYQNENRVIIIAHCVFVQSVQYALSYKIHLLHNQQKWRKKSNVCAYCGIIVSMILFSCFFYLEITKSKRHKPKGHFGSLRSNVFVLLCTFFCYLSRPSEQCK